MLERTEEADEVGVKGMIDYAINFRLNAAQIPAVNRQRITNAPKALSNALRLKLDLRFMALPFADFECDWPTFCRH